MYSKQVVDYAELLLKHKQAQQDMLEEFKLEHSKLELPETESKQQTPTIGVIEDNIENNTEDTQTKVVLSNCSDTLVKHQTL